MRGWRPAAEESCASGVSLQRKEAIFLLVVSSPSLWSCRSVGLEEGCWACGLGCAVWLMWHLGVVFPVVCGLFPIPFSLGEFKL